MGFLVSGGYGYMRFGEKVIAHIHLAIFTDMARAEEFSKALGKQMVELVGIWHDGTEVDGAWTSVERIPMVIGPPAEKPCGWCGATSGYETETDGWERCLNCGDN